MLPTVRPPAADAAVVTGTRWPQRPKRPRRAGCSLDPAPPWSPCWGPGAAGAGPGCEGAEGAPGDGAPGDGALGDGADEGADGCAGADGLDGAAGAGGAEGADGAAPAPGAGADGALLAGDGAEGLSGVESPAGSAAAEDDCSPPVEVVSACSSTLKYGFISNFTSSSAKIRALETSRSLRSCSTKLTAASRVSNWLYPGLPPGAWKITMCDTKLSSLEQTQLQETV